MHTRDASACSIIISYSTRGRASKPRHTTVSFCMGGERIRRNDVSMGEALRYTAPSDPVTAIVLMLAKNRRQKIQRLMKIDVAPEM